jgi:transcriptional regulator with XRE-family HTH domain
MTDFGDFVRERRERLRETDRGYSLRKVAERIGVQPSYLSKVATTLRLANELEVDGDILLALAGKVSTDLKEAIRKRPQLFGEMIRAMRDLPDHAVLRLVREVRDGDW